MTSTFTGTRLMAAVAISWLFIWNDPSPATHTTVLVRAPDGRADGRREAEAHGAQAARGEEACAAPRASTCCAAHIWCCPTSVTTTLACGVQPLGKLLHAPVSGTISSGRLPHVGMVERDSGARHSATWLEPRPRWLGLGARLLQARPRCVASTPLRSPTMGICTSRTLPISAGSMSMWTTSACGANSSSLPRHPVGEARARRDDEVAFRHARGSRTSSRACPRAPGSARCDAGNAPLPMSVVTTGMLHELGQRQRALRWRRKTRRRPPRRARGGTACLMRATACLHLLRRCRGRWACTRAGPRRRGYSNVTSVSLARSLGTSMSTGPGRPVLRDVERLAERGRASSSAVCKR